MICNLCNTKLNIQSFPNKEYSLWCSGCIFDLKIKQGNIQQFYMLTDFDRIFCSLANSTRYWRKGIYTDIPVIFPVINNDVLEVKEFLTRIRKLMVLS